jgi:SRSO17 transposase
VSVHAATDAASAPLDWRLFLPTRWDPAHAADEDDAVLVRQRRARAGIPDDVEHRPKWALALDMLDELAGWGQRPPVVCADAGYGNNGDFRHGLATRGLSYIAAVEDDLTAYPLEAVPEAKPYPGVGPYPKARYRTAPVPLREHVLATGRTGALKVSWREGSRGQLSSTFVAIRVRPAGRKHTHRLDSDGSLAAAWLLADWPDDEPTPVKYWISNLPEDTPITELVRLGKIRWRIEHDYRELKEALGLDHFEGRTWAGWHRHVTLVTAAHLFATTLRADPKALGAA